MSMEPTGTLSTETIPDDHPANATHLHTRSVS